MVMTRFEVRERSKLKALKKIREKKYPHAQGKSYTIRKTAIAHFLAPADGFVVCSIRVKGLKGIALLNAKLKFENESNIEATLKEGSNKLPEFSVVEGDLISLFVKDDSETEGVSVELILGTFTFRGK